MFPPKGDKLILWNLKESSNLKLPLRIEADEVKSKLCELIKFFLWIESYE